MRNELIKYVKDTCKDDFLDAKKYQLIDSKQCKEYETQYIVYVNDSSVDRLLSFMIMSVFAQIQDVDNLFDQSLLLRQRGSKIDLPKTPKAQLDMSDGFQRSTKNEIQEEKYAQDEGEAKRQKQDSSAVGSELQAPKVIPTAPPKNNSLEVQQMKIKPQIKDYAKRLVNQSDLKTNEKITEKETKAAESQAQVKGLETRQNDQIQAKQSVQKSESPVRKPSSQSRLRIQVQTDQDTSSDYAQALTSFNENDQDPEQKVQTAIYQPKQIHVEERFVSQPTLTAQQTSAGVQPPSQRLLQLTKIHEESRKLAEQRMKKAEQISIDEVAEIAKLKQAQQEKEKQKQKIEQESVKQSKIVNRIMKVQESPQQVLEEEYLKKFEEEEKVRSIKNDILKSRTKITQDTKAYEIPELQAKVHQYSTENMNKNLMINKVTSVKKADEKDDYQEDEEESQKQKAILGQLRQINTRLESKIRETELSPKTYAPCEQCQEYRSTIAEMKSVIIQLQTQLNNRGTEQNIAEMSMKSSYNEKLDQQRQAFEFQINQLKLQLNEAKIEVQKLSNYKLAKDIRTMFESNRDSEKSQMESIMSQLQSPGSIEDVILGRDAESKRAKKEEKLTMSQLKEAGRTHEQRIKEQMQHISQLQTELDEANKTIQSQKAQIKQKELDILGVQTQYETILSVVGGDNEKEQQVESENKTLKSQLQSLQIDTEKFNKLAILTKKQQEVIQKMQLQIDKQNVVINNYKGPQNIEAIQTQVIKDLEDQIVQKNQYIRQLEFNLIDKNTQKMDQNTLKDSKIMQIEKENAELKNMNMELIGDVERLLKSQGK